MGLSKAGKSKQRIVEPFREPISNTTDLGSSFKSSEEQDALLELRDIQKHIEINCHHEEYCKRQWRRVCQLMGVLNINPTDPLAWLVSVDGARKLERLATQLLPKSNRSLNQNDRDVLQSMYELGATSSVNPVPAKSILQSALRGYHKREWAKLQAGGYVLTDGPGSGGFYLTSLGRHVVSSLNDTKK